MAEARWSLVRGADGLWDVFDRDGSQIYRVSDPEGRRLFGQWRRSSTPLGQALSRPDADLPDLAFVDLEVAEGRVRYWSEDPAVVDSVAARFRVAVVPPDRAASPATYVEIEPHADRERLHRTVSSRTGVWECDPDGDRGAAMTGDLPVVPPLALEPWRGRFWALHAAMWMVADVAVVVCGAQRSGKTTLAVSASEDHDVLTDELVLIDGLTGRAWGVPLEFGVRGLGGSRSVRSLAHATPQGGVPVRRVVVLDSSDPSEADLGRTAALAALQPHVRACGMDAHAMFAAVSRFVDHVPVSVVGVPPWPELGSHVASLVAAIDQQLEME
jgi:hypothetical protein